MFFDMGQGSAYWYGWLWVGLDIIQNVGKDLWVFPSNLQGDAMAEAYQRAGNRAMRERQMVLARELGAGLDKYVRSRVIYATFKIASKPLHMAGLGVLYDFLDRGFAVMRPMGSAEEFLDLFIHKEESIMENLYAGRPNPFEF